MQTVINSNRHCSTDQAITNLISRWPKIRTASDQLLPWELHQKRGTIHHKESNRILPT